MIGVSNFRSRYLQFTTASAGGLTSPRFKLPQLLIVKHLTEPRSTSSVDDLCPCARGVPRGRNARRPRRGRLPAAGPRTGLARQRAILRRGGPRSAQVALLPRQHLELADRLKREIRLGRNPTRDIDGVLQ